MCSMNLYICATTGACTTLQSHDQVFHLRHQTNEEILLRIVLPLYCAVLPTCTYQVQVSNILDMLRQFSLHICHALLQHVP